MSYNTYYDLTILNTLDEKNIIKHLRSINEDIKYAFDENGDAEDETTWYDHETDMLEFSKLYPDLVFKLSGVGEDKIDLWKKYFKNGKMQTTVGKIVYDEFDESKLK
jgi:hypothetical protein